MRREEDMMITWNITITAPTGNFDATLQVSCENGKIAGDMTGKKGSGPMQDIVMTDSKLTWATKIQKPMPMSLKFVGDINGDTICGTVKFGIFASGTFEGQKVTTKAALLKHS
jgi:hypothetical protein